MKNLSIQDEKEFAAPVESGIQESVTMQDGGNPSILPEDVPKWLKKIEHTRTHYPLFFLYFFIPPLPVLVTIIKRDFDTFFTLLIFWIIAWIFSFLPVLGWFVIVLMIFMSAALVARRPKIIQTVK